MVSGVRFHHVLLLSTVSTDVPRIDPVLAARFADDAVVTGGPALAAWASPRRVCRSLCRSPAAPSMKRRYCGPLTPMKRRHPGASGDLCSILPAACPPCRRRRSRWNRSVTPPRATWSWRHVTARAVAERRPDRDDLCCGSLRLRDDSMAAGASAISVTNRPTIFQFPC